MMQLGRVLLLVLFGCAATAWGSAARGQDAGDAKDTPSTGGLTFELHPDYRVRTIYAEPYELSGTTVRDMFWTEQRLRLDMSMTYEGIGGVYVQLDALDGVLFGDNGRFGGDPSTNAGVSVAGRVPNSTRQGIGLREGGDPLDPDSYVPTLASAPPIQINYAFGDILLPIGLLRVGRQPLIDGYALAAHDGGRYRKDEKKIRMNGRRPNRWGTENFSDTADRILFGTKLDEIVRQLAGSGGKPDLDLNRGVFLGLFYGYSQQNSFFDTSDNLAQNGGALQWRLDEANWFGQEWRDIFASVILFHFNNEAFNTDIWSLPLRLEGRINNVSIFLQNVFIFGHTREIADGFAALKPGQTPQTQDLSAYGAQAIIDVDIGPVTATLEFDFASGDDDPRTGNPIKTYSFARDLNVGLLLFEHILAFESARSVAVGVENLISLNAKSFPLSEVQTDGRFTNALAIFPQLTANWIDTPKHHLHTRFGVLMAWPAANGVVDPVMTTLALDGTEVSDDAVNFHGGKPGSYYGTELDLQLQWVFAQHFEWTMESAYLIPGDSLQNQHGLAVNAFMFENRFSFLF
jgi:hypothetical protein